MADRRGLADHEALRDSPVGQGHERLDLAPGQPADDPDPGSNLDGEALQADWESQTGEAWDLFNTGYLEGWQRVARDSRLSSS